MTEKQIAILKHIVETGDGTYYHGNPRRDLLAALDRLEELEDMVTQIQDVIKKPDVKPGEGQTSNTRT